MASTAFSPADIQPNPRKTTSVRRLGQVDIARLREAVMALPEATWDAENADKPNRFEALDRTRHIVFRFVSDFQDWRRHYERPLWSSWRALLEPVMAQAVAPYGYEHAEYPRVMLAPNPAAKWPHKIHVPLLTNERVVFFVDGVGYHFVEGEAVEVSNMAVHAVENNGDTDRIHLIFEYVDADQPVPDWVGKLPVRA
jgi:hypothetical protein